MRRFLMSLMYFLQKKWAILTKLGTRNHWVIWRLKMTDFITSTLNAKDTWMKESQEKDLQIEWWNLGG